MGSWPGLYRGICMNNADPEKRFRLQVVVPQVSGNAVTDWAWPCLPVGWRDAVVRHVNDGSLHTHAHELVRTVPNPGDGVWIMYEGGDAEHPVWLGTF